MTPKVPHTVCKAMGKLRGGVVFGCWIVGLALFAQVIIWSLASFTDLRFDEPAAEATEAPLIVQSEPRQQRATRSLPLPINGDNGVTDEAPANEPLPPTRTHSRHDQRFAAIYNLAGGIGRAGMVIVVVLVMMGTMLGAASSVPGIDKGVGALLIALLMAMIVLPVGGALDLPWQDGAFTRYAHMTDWADRFTEQHDVRYAAERAASNAVSPGGLTKEPAAATEEPAASMVVFMTRFGLLPVTCIIGLTLIGMRFAASVEAAILPRESMRLDPALEREAANITPTSLHGGRGGNVINHVVGNGQPHVPSRSDSAPEQSIRQPTPGETPKRLI